MSSIDEKGLEAATIELLSHRGEHPRRVLRGGSELWETYLPAMRAAITAYLSALPTTSRDDVLGCSRTAFSELLGCTEDATAIRQLRSKE